MGSRATVIPRASRCDRFCGSSGRDNARGYHAITVDKTYCHSEPEWSAGEEPRLSTGATSLLKITDYQKQFGAVLAVPSMEEGGAVSQSSQSARSGV